MEKINCKRIDDLIEIVPCFVDMVVLWPYLIQTGIFNEDGCNIATLSLLEVGECDLHRSQVHVERTYIQLLELTGFSNPKLIQCKVEI